MANPTTTGPAPFEAHPMSEVLGFNPYEILPDISVEGLTVYAEHQEVFDRALTTTALKHALGMPARIDQAAVTAPDDETTMNIVRLTGSDDIADNVSGIVSGLRERFNDSVLRAFDASTHAMVEALVFDALGGIPQPEDLGGRPYRLWNKKNDRQLEKEVREEVGVSDKLLIADIETSDHIEAVATFRWMDRKAAEKDYEDRAGVHLYLWNIINSGSNWQLDSLALSRVCEVEAVGYQATSSKDVVASLRCGRGWNSGWNGNGKDSTFMTYQAHRDDSRKVFNMSEARRQRYVVEDFRRDIAPAAGTQALQHAVECLEGVDTI